MVGIVRLDSLGLGIRLGLFGVLKPFVCVNDRYGSGRAMAAWVRGITPKSLRAFERERGLKKKKKKDSTRSQRSTRGQESSIIFRRRKLSTQPPVSFVFCVSLLLFFWVIL